MIYTAEFIEEKPSRPIEEIHSTCDIAGDILQRTSDGDDLDGRAKLERVLKFKFEGIVARGLKSPLGYNVWKLKRELSEDVFCKGEFTLWDDKPKTQCVIQEVS